MKLSEVIPFLTFAVETDHARIEQQFRDYHSTYQSQFPYWSINATRRKLIGHFWYAAVFKHFLMLYTLAVSITFLINISQGFNPMFFLVAACLSGLVFIILMAFIYMPSFYSSYLPLLDSYVENYSGKQLEGIQKCKREQYSVMGLMLIQYVYHQLSGFEGSLLTDEHTNLLTKQYGVSQKMIDSTLRTIIFNDWDHKKERKRAEIMEAFGEAEAYFTFYNAQKANQLLGKLQEKLVNTTVKQGKSSRK